MIAAADLAAADGGQNCLADGVNQFGPRCEPKRLLQFVLWPGVPRQLFFMFHDEGPSVSSAGDVDDREDLIVGVPWVDVNGKRPGGVYLLAQADLLAADATDCKIDGIIELVNAEA